MCVCVFVFAWRLCLCSFAYVCARGVCLYYIKIYVGRITISTHQETASHLELDGARRRHFLSIFVVKGCDCVSHQKPSQSAINANNAYMRIVCNCVLQQYTMGYHIQ